MKFNVNPTDFYPHLVENDYPEMYSGNIEDSPFRKGDVVYDKGNKTVGIVLGVIDLEGGELRLDSDGMQPIKNLRPAKLEDFKIKDALYQGCESQISS